MVFAPSRGRRQSLAGACRRMGLLPLMGRLRDALRHDLRILAYHRVLDTCDASRFVFDLELVSASVERFEYQMRLLKRRFSPMRFDQVLECLDQGRRLPRRAVLVSFDDGYDDNYRHAFPILRDLRMSAMFFVSTGHIDSGLPYLYDWLVHMVCTTTAGQLSIPELHVDVPLPDGIDARRELAASLLVALKQRSALEQEALVTGLERRWRLPRAPHPDCTPMSWEQLREMREAGMEIGSHGVNHRMLAKLDDALMREELAQSRRALQSNLGDPALAISYPVGGYGAFDDRVEAAVGEAGYRFGCTYLSGTSRPLAASLLHMRRLHVERGVDAPWFRGMLEVPELFTYRTHALTA
jgi:peptidoglycan/xylan/chitin deacetylase (PgdA/CDA1 family)